MAEAPLMAWWWPFKRQAMEKRASGSGFTAELIGARAAYLEGRRGLAELSGTVAGCTSLWEAALASADVSGAPMLNRRLMALLARSLALRGEAVFLIRDDMLVPCSDWDLSTRDGRPRAYRLSLPETGGGTTQTALAAEVLHFVIGSDPGAPWHGSSPLRRAALSAELLHAVETSLGEVFGQGPIGSQIVPMPESDVANLEALGRSFRGQRGKVVLRESVHVQAAGGAAPSTDWRPSSLSPDLSRSMTSETHQAARDAILHAYGVLPALVNPAATGPLIREAQRHLAGWTLQPICELVAEEAAAKLGQPVKVDCMRPLQAWDAGGKARAFAGMIEAMGRAKEAGLEPAEVAKLLSLVGWADDVEQGPLP
jgi:phage portal protein BeeE